jgi:hypothetical protein
MTGIADETKKQSLGGSELNGGLEPLVPCPMCGGKAGYYLSEGSTYRWWNVDCLDCARTIDECSSDRRMTVGSALPARWDSADYVWNDAGDYANKLQIELNTLRGHNV